MMKLITEELLDTVTSRAKENSRLRMNYNFHASMDAPIHRLLNALELGTYLPPHRHTGKEETYLVLRGSLLAFFYDDAGNVTDKVCLNPSEGKYGLEIPSNTWHSIIALESGTVIFEIKKGPYQPLPSEDLASWAPQTSEKNFVIPEENDEQPDKQGGDKGAFTEDGEADLQKSEKPTSRSLRSRLQEVGKTDFKDSDNQTSGGRENELQEVGKPAPNYTDYNNTDMSYNNPINQSGDPEQRNDKIDVMEDVNAYIELIKQNIEYEHHMKYDKRQDRDLYEELFEVICEVVCVKRKTVRIAGEDYPYELVKSKFLKLNSGHLEYVIGCMHDTVTKITNIKAYMVTALYNAPSTMNHYYQQEVQHDMYGGGWEEKGIV